MSMTLYHATSEKMARAYRAAGKINAPVRGFTTIEGAMAWAMKTGRKVIYALDGDPAYKLPDHHNIFGEAWWIDADVPVSKIKCVFSAESDA
jgi:hypothetical protein